MSEKPNSAEFADQREIAMLKSRRNGNPALRMMPEISSARVAKTISETKPLQASNVATQSAEPEEKDIDFVATSEAIMEALRKTKGHLVLSDADRKEAASLIGGCFLKSTIFTMLLAFVLGGMVSLGVKQMMKNATEDSAP